MDKKTKKNFFTQRLDFFSEHKVDLYAQLFREEMLDVDVDKALKLSLVKNVDDNIDCILQRYKLPLGTRRRSRSSNVESVHAQISKYLKRSFQMGSLDLNTKKEIKSLIKKGEICDENINWVIFELSGARTLSRQNPKVYQQLMDTKDKYPAGYLDSIQMDVVRTITESDPIKKKKKQQSIQNVLEAYAIRNPFVGYCQGQNFIVDFILHSLNFEDEDAFWIYVAIIELCMPLDYYTSVVSALIDQRIMEHYLGIYIPQLTAHFKQIGLECNFFTISWFICIFTQTLHVDITKEVFLRLLISGIRALIIASITILFIHLDEILLIKEFSDVSTYLQSHIIKFSDIDHFRFVYNQINLKKKPFNFAREQLRQEALTKQSVKLTKRNIAEIENIPKCDDQSPICQKVIETNKLLRRNFSFFVFQQLDPIEIISDYLGIVAFLLFSDIHQEDQDKVKLNEHMEYGNVLIGKQFHVCKEPYDIEEEAKTMYRTQALVDNYNENNIFLSQYSTISRDKSRKSDDEIGAIIKRNSDNSQ